MDTYSFVTYTKIESFYLFVFESDLVPDTFMKVRLLPRKTNMLFSELDIHHMKLRDPEVILYMLELYGLTLILEGLNNE